jgi:hypothetical protein
MEISSMSVSEPGKIITPWAESGLKNPIPPASNPATGRAGFDQGFSAINMTAKEAGGIPPFGQDFNGIFYEITNILRYMQAGGQPTFSSALATSIGGYPKGAMVLGSDGVTLWQSKVESNSDNPDTTPTNWQDISPWKTGIPRGNGGVDYAMSGCAVRRDTLVGPDWAPVSDTAHLPIRVNGVTGGVNVNVQYDGLKIGTFVAGPDESFAADGTLVGGSVAANNANVSLGSPCSFYINFDNSNQITFDQKMFGPSRFGVSVAASGLITITHPNRRLMQMPLCQHTSGGSQFEPLIPHYINTTSPGVTALYLVGQAEGLVSYNGTSWVLSSSAWSTSDINVTYDAGTGELVFTHPTLMGSPGCAPQSWYNGELINIGMKTLTSSGFTLVLRKASDNTPPALSSALGFYFDRGMSAIRKAPAGRLNVFLGHVQVDCSQVDYPNGNFWFMAAMQE